MSSLKVDDRAWEMPTYAGEPPSPRRLRVWETRSGDLLAVITETGEGVPVTDVAAEAYAAVRELYAGARVFEHYPQLRDEQETLDEIRVADGEVGWTRVVPGDVDADWLPLDD
ncbi:hypothetical protein [Solicola gregarius]|uniref:Uncharacterized protein n=1 Tax=Solicola gregarius TaxID=2908642 RepID=A0AA46TLV0_9ACTN|nr:hypothetical protein [Solicola gregarius]UYM07666.1 hypothetical protein L0C25_11520 [Solicola gregarius]